ncbi:MAG: hypothetical protein MMC23_006047 [Stictis urceolatum]|nr:hypothetical protein [Stictis urceolata]
MLQSPTRPGLVHLTESGKPISLPDLDSIPVRCQGLLPCGDDDEVNTAATHDFFTFPGDKYGLRFDTNGKRIWNKNITQPDPVDGRWKEEPIVQRWLFFELLREVVGHIEGFRYSHFICSESGQDLISTEHLPYYLEEWRKKESNGTQAEQTLRLARIQRVLDHARFFASRYCCVDDAEGNPVWPVNGLIALSIVVLGETLTRAQIIIQNGIGHQIMGWSNHDYRSQGWGFSKAVLEKLHRQGWCMKTVHMLQGLLRRNTIGLLYLHSLQITPPPGHRHCTSNSCSVRQTPTVSGRPSIPKYPLKHHCNPMNRDTCHRVGPNIHRVAEIIRNGGTPLMRWSKAENKLHVEEMNRFGAKDYAIFSHVWSDGYGNPDSNEINVCVLNLFQELFQNIRSQTGRNNQPSRTLDLFWIDTLTIPVSNKYKAEREKAISQMHDIYKWAKYTIVLDSSLMKLRRGNGYPEPAMKITMSSWMTRLWTLQEAVLSRHLYFNFVDDLYSMEELEELYISDNESLSSCIPEVAHAYWYGILGAQRDKIHTMGDSALEPEASFVATVWKATQWRTTSHLHHETLALATLMNLDTTWFADTSNATMGDHKNQRILDKQMRKLLDMLAQSPNYPIPAGFIFLAGPKLTGKGYGWAPRTWLSQQEVDPPDPLEPALRKDARFIPGSGFEVQYPGYKLHQLGPKSTSALWTSKHFNFPVDSTLLEWYNVEKADDWDRFPTDAEINGRMLALILPRLPVMNTREIAVLVAINQPQNDAYNADILARVWTSRERDQKTLEQWREGFQKNAHQTAFLGEELMNTQRWFVDGKQVEEEVGSDSSILSSIESWMPKIVKRPTFAKKIRDMIPFGRKGSYGSARAGRTASMKSIADVQYGMRPSVKS